MAGSSAVPSCLSGEISAGSTPCSWSILCTAQGYSLLVTQSLSRCDARRGACRQERGEQRGHVRGAEDEADVEYRHVKDHRAESLVDDEEAIRLPNADQRADDQADDRDEARLHQERLLDSRAAEPERAQHADLLPSLHDGARADHTETGDAHAESKGQESRDQVQQRENAAELLRKLVGDDHWLELVGDQYAAQIKARFVQIDATIDGEVVTSRGERRQPWCPRARGG